jgi:hypothetical protein
MSHKTESPLQVVPESQDGNLLGTLYLVPCISFNLRCVPPVTSRNDVRLLLTCATVCKSSSRVISRAWNFVGEGSVLHARQPSGVSDVAAVPVGHHA